MSFQLGKTFKNFVISMAIWALWASIVRIFILSWKLINLIDFSGEKSDKEENPDIAKIKKVQSSDGKANLWKNFEPF